MEQNLIKENDEIEIDLRELFFALWKKKLLIILVGVVFTLAGYLGTKLLMTEYYTSSTALYVLNQQTEGVITQSDLSSGTQLTSDYQYMITTRIVLEEAIKELNLEMSYEELKSNVSVAVTSDRILTVTVTNSDQYTAKYLADAIRESASVHIDYVTDGLTNIRVWEEADLPTDPSGPNAKRNGVIAGAAAVAVAIIIILLIFILDDTIKSPDDVEKYLGVSVLGNIPLVEQGKGNKKKRKKSRKRGGKK